jgi:hypothetical protein
MVLIFGEDGSQVRFAEDQRSVEDFAAQRADARRSQIAFILGAWTVCRPNTRLSG